jgi:hypothetical protein
MSVNTYILPFAIGLVATFFVEEAAFTAWFAAYGRLKDLSTPRVPKLFAYFPSLHKVAAKWYPNPPPGTARTLRVAQGRARMNTLRNCTRYATIFNLVWFALAVLAVIFFTIKDYI